MSGKESRNNKPAGGGYQGNKPSNNSYRGNKPTGSGYQGSKPTEGGYRGSKPTEGGYRGSKPTEGGYRGSKPTEGGYRGSKPTEGGYRGSKPTEGGYRGSKPTEGGYRGSKPIEGGYRDSKPTEGGYRGSKPTEGGYRGSKPTEGGYRGSKPTEGGYRGSKPTEGGYRGSKPTEGGYRGDSVDADKRTFRSKPTVATSTFHINPNDEHDEDDKQECIAGRNSVIEALKAGSPIDVIHIAEIEQTEPTPDGKMRNAGSLGKIKALAREAGLVVKMSTPQKLSAMCGGLNHQGVVAILSCVVYSTLEDILAISEKKGKAPFIIIADEIEDPHNLGAIIRTAEACGADGLILPKRRSASLTATVYKTSAGAASILPVAKVANIVACIKELKERNIWIYGADTEGKRWCELNLAEGGIAFVIGSEGGGLGRLVKEECDFLATLPMCGQINSLNASVAAGILMYEVARQRGY